MLQIIPFRTLQTNSTYWLLAALTEAIYLCILHSINKRIFLSGGVGTQVLTEKESDARREERTLRAFPSLAGAESRLVILSQKSDFRE